jgi:hypothetical protein
MDFALEFFVWSRPVDGYVWEDGKATDFFGQEVDGNDANETRFLRWRTSDRRVYRTNLLQTQPALYRTFANLEPTEEAFLKFANEYGALGVDVLVEDAVKSGKTEDGKTVKTLSFENPRNGGEPFWRWRREHSQIQRIATLLGAIENDDPNLLRKWFTIGDSDIRFESEQRWAVVSSAKHQLRPHIWTWVMQSDDEAEQLRRAARAWAQTVINEAMSSGGNTKQSLTSVRILLNPDRSTMRLHLVPDTLLAAMWLQCSRVLTENVTFRACEQCLKWFEVSPDQRRRNTKYCTDRCKVAAYRVRKVKGTNVET